MKTTHNFFFHSSESMSEIEDESAHLIVTSPPYPMIEMWDNLFGEQNLDIRKALNDLDGRTAFKLMHKILNKVWKECYRVLVDGGIACINIGDATRKIGDEFQLYQNHSEIIYNCTEIGFKSLPIILWRKPTNAPNKFMGSGMLPGGAYVTLEHEYILILRKGKNRSFTPQDRLIRQESAYFWEERNTWFSDIWDIRGVNQNIVLKETRNRSAAFPLELPYRLINMYSIKNDTIIDPFAGTGTTNLAALILGRNSIGYEIDRHIIDDFSENIKDIKSLSNKLISKRLEDHLTFVQDRFNKELPVKYVNKHYNFPVITNQEKNLKFEVINTIENLSDNMFIADYGKKNDLMNWIH